MLLLLVFIVILQSSIQTVVVNGPGLQPQKIVMPARYFYVNFTNYNEKTYSSNLNNELAVEIEGKSKKSGKCRIWVNKLDRKDGTFIVRYKLYDTCYDMKINIYHKKSHIDGSPFGFTGPIQPDQCICPQKDFHQWLQNYGCPSSYPQISHDLRKYHDLDMQSVVKKVIEKYHKPESISFCHYVIKANELYRNCYGKHVGFNMFADNVFLFLTWKAVLPDMELVINLGDWPLVHKSAEPLPVFSWCGSDEAIDIVMPTYDITESTIENMGRVTLDTLSVQGSISHAWADREPMAIWRGRDSRAERLKLIDIARKHPDLINASLTNFFFYRDKEASYGPKVPHISFFKFFDYKYQINIDGTVAAYRFPYLLSGGGLVLKQESPYYEHFYKQARPWQEYVPIARDLSDLVEKIQWAKENDDEAYRIATNARKFANENLMPQHVICYHAVLFSEWSKRIKSEVKVIEGMTHVPQPAYTCDCQLDTSLHEEL